MEYSFFYVEYIYNSKLFLKLKMFHSQGWTISKLTLVAVCPWNFSSLTLFNIEHFETYSCLYLKFCSFNVHIFVTKTRTWPWKFVSFTHLMPFIITRFTFPPSRVLWGKTFFWKLIIFNFFLEFGFKGIPL